MLVVNVVGSRVVDRAQSAIVVALLAVFAVFIGATITEVDWDMLAFSGYPSASDIVASVALTFFAYLGFSVISFAVGDLEDPARGLPRAMYGALGVTAALYVLISFGVFGTEKFDFQMLGPQDRAIQAHKRRLRALRKTVQNTGGNILAGSGSASQQHAAVGLCDA